MSEQLPVKVMHVITRLDTGGSAQNTLLTVLGHDRQRFDPVLVFGVPEPGALHGGRVATDVNRQRLEKEGVVYYEVTSLRRAIHPADDLRALRALVRLMRRERPVIVHTHTSKAGLLGRLAAWLADVPIVVHTPHGHVFYGHFNRALSWLFLQLERAWARGTDRLVALTEAERQEHLERGVGRPAHFHVIPSGIDLQQFAAIPMGVHSGPPDWPCPPEARVIGSVGWLTPVKGHAVLLEAFASLRTLYPALHLVILGNGPLRDRLLARAAALQLQDRVHLLGLREQVVRYLAGMEVFVLPSMNEGMGRALVEAMAAGRPVIATRVGGVPAIVRHRESGLLVAPNDATALAACLDECLRRPIWARQLGIAARGSITDSFDTASMVRSVETVFQTALRARGLV